MIGSSASTDLPRIAEVLVAGDQNIHAALDRILRHKNCRLRHVTTCREAIAFAHENETAVLICERKLPDGDWTTVLTELESSRKRPNLIVTSRLPDDALWAEVLNRGGYDVLSQPFDREEVFRVIDSVWRRWNFL